MANSEDKWSIGGHEFSSRFILGSGKYDLDLIQAAVECAEPPLGEDGPHLLHQHKKCCGLDAAARRARRCADEH